MCPKGIEEKSEILETLGERAFRVLAASLMAKAKKPPSLDNRVKSKFIKEFLIYLFTKIAKTLQDRIGLSFEFFTRLGKATLLLVLRFMNYNFDQKHCSS